ncbi:MAG: hypothetical protein HYS13_23885 [Planctomycetia bacterium]|nr:hypothetical protein [Planctomycetia bacterium]
MDLFTRAVSEQYNPRNRLLLPGNRMLKPFERPITDHELYLKLFITTSGGW